MSSVELSHHYQKSLTIVLLKGLFFFPEASSDTILVGFLRSERADMKDFERETEGLEDLSYKYLGVEIDNPLKFRRYVVDTCWICDICNHMNFPTGKKLNLT